MNMADALKEAARKVRVQNAASIVADLDSLSRERALTEQETARLARAISQDRISGHRRYYWTAEMDQQLLTMLRSKVRVADIAAKIGVSLKAAEMRAWRLRKSGVANGN